MKNKELENRINKIISDIEIAEEEIYRPLEDVVTLSVCYKVRNSIAEILKLFLDSKNVKYNNNNNLETLFSLCTSNVKDFDTIDISKVYCKSENNTSCNDKYCLSLNKVAECITIAENLRDIILKKLNK
ncbi:MAG: hypothetical protein IT243_06975 [Bacteroidia bacterium]|nr:hypothetical protein [Bacteroidia bacterium]